MELKVDLDGILDLSNKNLEDLSILRSFNDLYKCKVLKLNYNHLTKIENIDIFKNLEELNLGHNKISKIENLNKLRKLKKLLLYTNEIRIIEGLSGLKNLQELNLGYNKIDEIQRLEALKNLKVLILDNNNIVKITNCESLISIQTINLDENPIQEIKSIGELPNLTTLRIHNNCLPLTILNALEMERTTPVVPDIEKVKAIARNEFVQIRDKIIFAYNLEFGREGLGLNLNFCELESIRSIENLSNIKGLKVLDLWTKKINKIEGLDELKDLESLSLGNNEITKIEGLDSLKKLKSLTLDKNKITMIENLGNLVSLKYLSLRENQISTISGLTPLEDLEILDLESNKIQDLKEIESLKKITKLNFSDNPSITDFSMLSKLFSLKRLILKKNEISDISMLNLENLIELDLSENNISEIPKMNLPKLKILKLNKNKLKTMDSLCQFPNLEYLNLNENQIEELKCIDKMKHSLNKFYIDDNKLNLYKDQIDKLKISDDYRFPNNSRRFILYVLLKNFFDSKQDQGQEEIDFDELIDNSPILQKLKNMNEYPNVRNIVKMFKKDYEIRVAPNNIPKSIVTPKKIAQEIEEKILNYLVPGRKAFPLEDIVTEHHLGNKKAVKRLLRIIKDKELTNIPFIFTDTEIIRAPEMKKEVSKERNKKNY